MKIGPGPRIAVAAALLAISLVLGLVATGPGAQAAAGLSVSIYPTSRAFAPGDDASFVVRAEGDDAELARLDFTVDGGSLSGVISLAALAPNAAEGVVFVKRDTPGEATLVAHYNGIRVASATALFATHGQIRVTATLAAGPDAAARTWLYEVVDGHGVVVQTLSIGTSGDAPAGTAVTAAIPLGMYTVRQVFGNDTATACAPGLFYEVTSPAGAAIEIDLAALEAAASFTIGLCEDAPTGLQVHRTDQPDPPIDEVRGARSPGPPLPPAAGSGLVPGQPAGSRWQLLLIAILVAGHAALVPVTWLWWRQTNRYRRA